MITAPAHPRQPLESPLAVVRDLTYPARGAEPGSFLTSPDARGAYLDERN